MFREFFYMHKSDRRVILALLTVAVVAVVAITLVGGGDSEAPVSSVGVWGDAIAPSAPSAPPPSSPSPYYTQPEVRPERFAFDPNTADSTALLRLGLQPWQVQNIYKYRARGGIYRKKEDFARLYGLTVKQYRELEPYIHISADYQPAASLFSPSRPSAESAAPASEPAPVGPSSAVTPTDSHGRAYKLSPGETIDLSTADTADLKRIPGIGSYYARRIADYRDRLGGYVSLSQLNEIEDFPQEALPYLTLSSTVVRRLNVNTLSLNELKRHPYINFYQARAITDFRRQHGAISDLSDLRLLPDFPSEAIERLRPYVEY